jgi:D-3-phosphoglycerate dehydrogenase
VRLINCARGGIIDEQALHEALVAGKVAGAALDVYEEEPAKAHPLFKLDQVVVTPHLGASTEEAQLNVAIDVAKQVADALLGRGIRNAVNMPSVDGATLKVLQPYLLLGEKLGSLASQLLGKLDEVRITYVGEPAAHDTASVTLAVLKGLLQPMVGENVNYVNASLIASERGINVIEAKASQLEEFVNLLALDVRGDGQSLTVQGTLSARREPRIVKIEDFFVEVSPVGYLLIIHNQDKPGLIGALGTLLGKSQINIAGMSNGRERPGGTAVTVVSVDQPVPPDVLAQVKQLQHVVEAKLIAL